MKRALAAACTLLLVACGSGGQTPSVPSGSATAAPVIGCYGGLPQVQCPPMAKAALDAAAGSGHRATHVWVNSGLLCPVDLSCLFDPLANFPYPQPPEGGTLVGNAEIAFAGMTEHAGVQIVRVGVEYVGNLLGYSTPPAGWCVPGTCGPLASTPPPSAAATVPATVVDPSGIFVAGQAMTGDGWRVLLAVHHGWVPLPGASPALQPMGTQFDLNWLAVADTAPSLANLWALVGETAPPSVDLGREIVAALGLLTGEGPVCGQVRLDGITFDLGQHEVVAHFQHAEAFEPLPPAPSGTASVCSAVGAFTVVVVALARDHLPAGSFTLRIDDPIAPRQSPLPEIEVPPSR